MLLASHEHLNHKDGTIPGEARMGSLKEAAGLLVKLYDATGQPGKAAEWRNQQVAGAEAVYRAAARKYREAAEGQDAKDLNNLAWFLATCADSKFRDGPGALRFAEKAVAATDRTNAMYLDTLAAAYAETGNFAEAIKIQSEAMSLVNDEEGQKDLAHRLRLYQSHTPCRTVQP